MYLVTAVRKAYGIKRRVEGQIGLRVKDQWPMVKLWLDPCPSSASRVFALQ